MVAASGVVIRERERERGGESAMGAHTHAHTSKCSNMSNKV